MKVDVSLPQSPFIHIDGFDEKYEVLEGWAQNLQRSTPIHLWIHNEHQTMPIKVICSHYRPDLKKAGYANHFSFRLSIDSLPKSWQVKDIKTNLYFSFSKVLVRNESTPKIQLPPILNDKNSMRLNYIENYNYYFSEKARPACRSMQLFGGYYRHWYFNKYIQSSSERQPWGFTPELRALSSSSITHHPLNPYTQICPVTWLGQLFENPFSEPPRYIEESKDLYELLWSIKNKTYQPEDLKPQWRQYLIDKVMSSYTSNKVSVIIPTWNRKDIIVKAINSALHQTISPFEIIVIDDGSTDKTIDHIKSYFPTAIDENTIKLIRQHHEGVSTARNSAMSVAKGTWFAYLDSDNSWHCDHLLINLFSALYNKDCPAIVYSGRAYYGSRISGLNERVSNFCGNKILEGNFIDLNCMIHHRDLYVNYGGFNTSLDRLVDWELILRYSKYQPTKKILPVNISTVNYWQLPNIMASISSTESIEIAKARIKAIHDIKL